MFLCVGCLLLCTLVRFSKVKLDEGVSLLDEDIDCNAIFDCLILSVLKCLGKLPCKVSYLLLLSYKFHPSNLPFHTRSI